MLAQLTAFVRDLRLAGVPVSLTEEIDAARALNLIELHSSVSFREALRCSVAKSRPSQMAFEPVYEAHFGPRLPPASQPDTACDDSHVLSVLAGKGDLPDLASAIVDASGGFETGSPAGVRYHVMLAMASLQREALFARLLRSEGEEEDGLEALRRRADMDARWSELELEIEHEVHRRVARARGQDSVIADARSRFSYNIEFSRATAREVAELRANLAPLARRLASKLGRQRRHARRGRLDFRNTMRHSLQFGGSTIELRFKRAIPATPELVVLADISESVTAFSRFTMQLVFALSKEFRNVRTFAFIDAVDEVSALLTEQSQFESALAEVAARADVVWRDGNSDYGHALTEFWAKYEHAINRRTTVLILGDGRTNYHRPRPEALAAIEHAARRVVWLNPEPAAYWGVGDSAMPVYARHCHEVLECRSLRQLTEAFQHII